MNTLFSSITADIPGIETDLLTVMLAILGVTLIIVGVGFIKGLLIGDNARCDEGRSPDNDEGSKRSRWGL